MSSPAGRTRREILADAAKVAAAASVSGLAGCFPDVGGRWPAAASPGMCKADAGTSSDAGTPAAVSPAVVEVFRQDSVVTGAKTVIKPDVVAAMLDAGLTALARQVSLFNGSSAQNGGAEAAEAGQPESDGGVDNPWTVLLPNYKPGQSIGLKVNCLNPYGVTTSVVLTRAIIDSLHDKLGVDPTTIVVWDRFRQDLEQNGGFSSGALAGAQLVGNLIRGLNPGESEDDPNLTEGHGFGDPVCSAPIGVPPKGDTASYPRLSRILTKETALTINCPVFKVHNISGITGAVKNIYGMINNPVQYHSTNLQTDMPKLYALPDIRNRISLTILDALIGVVTGNGPDDHPDPNPPRRILLAQDPLALDSYVLDLMKQLRALSGVGPIDPNKTGWLAKAADAGLGTTNYSLYQV
jgi:hypothetical protein